MCVRSSRSFWWIQQKAQSRGNRRTILQWWNLATMFCTQSLLYEYDVSSIFGGIRRYIAGDILLMPTTQIQMKVQMATEIPKHAKRQKKKSHQWPSMATGPPILKHTDCAVPALAGSPGICGPSGRGALPASMGATSTSPPLGIWLSCTIRVPPLGSAELI